MILAYVTVLLHDYGMENALILEPGLHISRKDRKHICNHFLSSCPCMAWPFSKIRANCIAGNAQIKAVTSCSTHKIDQQETDG